jgi:hypothetical protein
MQMAQQKGGEVHTDVEPLEVGERLRSVMLGETEPANRESAVSRFSSTASMLTGRHVRAWICAKVTRRATSGSQTKAAPPTSATPRIKTSHRRALMDGPGWGRDALDSRPSSSFRP